MAQLKFYDAHNHLQDARFGGRQTELLEVCGAHGIARMVVNGSCEEDWPEVLALARTHPEVLPSFGYHPWHAHERTPNWVSILLRHLDALPSAVGEAGLDRWKPGLDYPGQEEVFLVQMRLAAERDLPLSIHCLRAWGRLLELLRVGPCPTRGFLLHSFGGPREMVTELVRLGGYFSFPGYYLHERKERQRETFRRIPRDRLVVETDAPDQPLPQNPPTNTLSAEPESGWRADGLADPATGKPLNHPASLPRVYQGLAAVLALSLETLTAQVEENFQRLFRGL